MRRYGIARYLTPEQRQRAAAAEYELVPNGMYDGGCATPERLMLRVAGRPGVCPLGVALGIDGCPSLRIATQLLCGRHHPPAIRAVAVFTRDADTGKLRPEDIPTALGAKP